MEKLNDIEKKRLENKYKFLNEQLEDLAGEIPSSSPLRSLSEKKIYKELSESSNFDGFHPELQKKRIGKLIDTCIEVHHLKNFEKAVEYQPKLERVKSLEFEIEKILDFLRDRNAQKEIEHEIGLMKTSITESQKACSGKEKSFVIKLKKDASHQAKLVKSKIRNSEKESKKLRKKLNATELKMEITDNQIQSGDGSTLMCYALAIFGLALAVNTGYQLGDILGTMGRPPVAGWAASLLIIGFGIVLGNFYERINYPRWLYYIAAFFSGLSVLCFLIIMLANASLVEEVLYGNTGSLWETAPEVSTDGLFTEFVRWLQNPCLAVIVLCIAELWTVSVAHIIWSDHKFQSQKALLRRKLEVFDNEHDELKQQKYEVDGQIDDLKKELANFEMIMSSGNDVNLELEFQKTSHYRNHQGDIERLNTDIRFKENKLEIAKQIDPDREEIALRFVKLKDKIRVLTNRIPNVDDVKRIKDLDMQKYAGLAQKISDEMRGVIKNENNPVLTHL